jgi:peptide/nickel transport system substrate-binding protein/oligopeptide transport system substrate-binding protein
MLSACSPWERLVKAPADKQVLTLPQTGITDFDTLDPALAHDDASIRAVQMLYTGLVQYNDKMEIVPQLAQSWKQESDGVTWTFQLKKNLTFSNGKPLTSKDVAYSLERALKPETQSTVAPLYLDLLKDSDKLLAGTIDTLLDDSIKTPDDGTIVLIAKEPAAYFLDRLTLPSASVVNKELIDKYGAKFVDHLAEGAGAGPFVVSKYVRGQSITFVPNQHYYNTKPQLQKVVFSIYHSPEEAYNAYLKKSVDIAPLPFSRYTQDKGREDFHQVKQLWTNYYTMNYLAKPFQNIRIRQAFALALDKKAIADQIWQGSVIPTNHIIPEGMPGYNPDLLGPDGTQNLSGNAQKAKELLQQGLKEEQLSRLEPVTLSYATGNKQLEQEAQEIVKQWQSVLNVTVKAEGLDYNTLLDRITATTHNSQGLQIWGLSWVGEYASPQNWLTYQFGTKAFNNNMNYGVTPQQKELQQKLAQADKESNPESRMQTYKQAEQQLVNDVAWIPMEQFTSTFLRTPYIVGMPDTPSGIIPPDSWSNIYRVEPA